MSNKMQVLLLTVICFVNAGFGLYAPHPNATLTPVVLRGDYNETTLIVNRTVEYIIIYEVEKTVNETLLPIRVSVSTEPYADNKLPILVVVREQDSVLSWQVPLSVTTVDGQTIKFKNTSRTLCPDDPLGLNRKTVKVERIISISTASETNVIAYISVKKIPDMIVKEGEQKTVTVSPSTPNYYLYQFSNVTDDDEINYRTVVLSVNSNDSICMSISIQKVMCPVYDLEQEIPFQGYHETMTTQGGITLSQKQFPNGFYIVFVPKVDDSDCSASTANKNNTFVSRDKTLTFKIMRSISYNDYKMAIIYTFAFIFCFYFFFVLVLCFCARRHHFKPLTLDSIVANMDAGEVVDATRPNISSSHTVSSIVTEASTARMVSSETSSNADTDSPIAEELDPVNDSDNKETTPWQPIRSLADLARKRTNFLRHQSHLYLWNVVIVSIFYGLPVIQLVIRYQEVLNQTGDQDACYYNFLCAHPLGFLSDFNHVFSNLGYVCFGVLFLILTKRREKMHFDEKYERQFGIPQHYGLFYTMGMALIMEGIVSGSYHVCPNSYNFQFDSSFMYIMASLCMVKLYQSRHPDVNVRSHGFFCVLAIIIFLGMVGIFMSASIYFWAFFTILHVGTCSILSLYIYHMGRFKLDIQILRSVHQSWMHEYYSEGFWRVIRPHYKHRLVMLSLMNIANWIIAYYGLIYHNKDFATHILLVLMGNAMLYLSFYLIMKIISRECIQIHTLFYLLIATVLAGLSYYFFSHKTISWQTTPAQSKFFNQPCRILRFYDNHDIWHFLSALTMFFTFMVLLSLDDDLVYTDRNKIAVF